ncbi:tyrosine-protein kinase TXK-like isoform X2 [Pomacea canaliculata]|uniref:tyrosine-protein kinase TXK-like isoform X2 n=1 Tax=Pomacea canaliculata TaxID=400727 RepID=UPI000D733D08|nr:tyrosine-protein kinase TXK-like isoform X2 [Pomacea canaliculata]
MPLLKSSSRMSAANIVKQGSLQKRSQNKGRFTAENYKRRYFVLTKDHLKYYDGNSDRHGKKKGEILLMTAMVVEFVEDFMLENKKNAFQVVYKESSDFFTLYMVASTEEERTEWVEAIRNEAANRGANFLNKYHRGVWTKSMGKFNCCDQMDRNAVGCVLSTPERSAASNNSAGISIPSFSTPGTICPPPPPVRPTPAIPGKTPTYIAIYDYDPVEEGDLELCKGEEYEILDNSREHWWLAKNKKGKQGYIPSNYVKKKFDLEIYDWYYKDLSRNQAESILKENSHEGCFLVRDSISTPGSYSLSLYTRESGLPVRHYHIKKNAQGFFYIAENHVFESIPDVINYHKFNAGGLVTRLREPPQRTSKPTTAGFGHSQWEIDPKDLEIGEQLGAGCFGSVHKGSFRGQVVAVKRMKEHTMSEEAFKEEARTMTQLSHKNLVQLYGVVLKSRPMCIVTELMRNGALNNYLQRHRSRLMQQVSRLLDMCVQVCQGMTYLESRKFIHRDLAARNCLVGDNTMVKVADFGLARYVLDDEYQSSAGTKFPVKWAPPEVLQYTRFSSKSDVWAYGILMWEVFTCGDMPYKEKRNIDVVEYVVTQNKRLAKPASAPMIIYQIMMKCWDKDPEIRPSFAELQKQLSELNKEA